MPQKDRRTGKRSGSSAARLDALIAEALLDTTDDSEQRTAFCTILGDSLALPFTTQILGVNGSRRTDAGRKLRCGGEYTDRATFTSRSHHLVHGGETGLT